MPPSPGDAMTDLERVARALAPRAWAALGNGDTLAQKSRRTASLRHARAAFAAVHDPSEAMIAAADADAGGFPSRGRNVWRAMIDAILSAPQP